MHMRQLEELLGRRFHPALPDPPPAPLRDLIDMVTKRREAVEFGPAEPCRRLARRLAGRVGSGRAAISRGASVLAGHASRS